MRISITLAFVACGGNTPPARPTTTVHDAGISDAAIEDAGAIATAPDAAPIEDISMETTSQTPGRHPRVPGKPTQSLGLDRKQIRDVIKQHMRGLLDCYEKLSPNAAPAIHLEFTIGPDGRVTKASATGAQGELDACVVKVLEATRFPKPAGVDHQVRRIWFRRGVQRDVKLKACAVVRGRLAEGEGHSVRRASVARGDVRDVDRPIRPWSVREGIEIDVG